MPPPNWGMVEDGLYRSGQPSELNFPFLEKLKLKTVVWLAPEDPNPRLSVATLHERDLMSCAQADRYVPTSSLNFLDDQGITLHHLGGEPRAARLRTRPLGQLAS